MFVEATPSRPRFQGAEAHPLLVLPEIRAFRDSRFERALDLASSSDGGQSGFDVIRHSDIGADLLRLLSEMGRPATDADRILREMWNDVVMDLWCSPDDDARLI